jgi:peptidoglycan/LPS O-acetylase OafA/YrhL
MIATEARIRYVDGCRAVAVLGVLLYHSVSHAAWAQHQLTLPLSTVPLRWCLTLFAKGAHGVDLFFVISGFCLSYPSLILYHRQGKAEFRVDRFLAKRLVRILPPYYLALLLCLAAFFAFRISHVGTPTAINAALGPWDVLGQALMLDRGVKLANGAFWTLFVEFRWYLLFPLLLALWVRSQRAYGVLWCVLIVAYHATRARSVDVGVLPAFMLGIVAADWQITKHPLCAYAPILTAIAADIAFLLEPFSSMPMPDGTEEYGFHTQGNIGWYLACFFFILAGGTWMPLRVILESLPLRIVGVASYSMYLVHQPIVSFCAETLGADLGRYGSFAWGLGASVGVGLAFWYTIERFFSQGHPFYARSTAMLGSQIGILLRQGGLPLSFSLLPVPEENANENGHRNDDQYNA